MSSRLHILSLSRDQGLTERCHKLCEEFKFSFLSLNPSADLSPKATGFEQIQLIVASLLDESKEEAAQIINALRVNYKESAICVVVRDNQVKEYAEIVKNSGASLVLSQSSLHKTSELEYVASQIIRASFVPVKLAEFPKDSVLDFTLFHLMPLNQKLLPVLPKGSPLTEARLQKLETIGEVFVRREEVDRYRHYVEGRSDVSAQGIRSRCRAQYLSFCNAHSQLMFLLIDQSQVSSREGKWLYDRCEILARDLLTTLSSVGEAWEVVNNSSLGEFGSIERAPTTAAYAGLLALLSSLGEPIEIMVGSLLADVGMLDFHPDLSRKLRQIGNIESLTEAEHKVYKTHPEQSVARCQSRSLPMKGQVEELILNSHERIDGKGFPLGKKGKEIPMEAMLLQFSELIDRGAMVQMGQARTSVQEVRRRLVDQEMHGAHIFSHDFLQKLKPVL